MFRAWAELRLFASLTSAEERQVELEDRKTTTTTTPEQNIPYTQTGKAGNTPT